MGHPLLHAQGAVHFLYIKPILLNELANKGVEVLEVLPRVQPPAFSCGRSGEAFSYIIHQLPLSICNGFKWGFGRCRRFGRRLAFFRGLGLGGFRGALFHMTGQLDERGDGRVSAQFDCGDTPPSGTLTDDRPYFLSAHFDYGPGCPWQHSASASFGGFPFQEQGQLRICNGCLPRLSILNIEDEIQRFRC